MKNLSKHINEKLIINKNYKQDIYQCIQPNNHGVCLELGIHRTGIENTEITYQSYVKNEDSVTVRDNEKYYLNNEGYYCDVYNDNWVYVLLFGEDAETFLNILLNDPHQEMNIECFAKSYIKNDNYNRQCLNVEKSAPFTKYAIEDILDIIK